MLEKIGCFALVLEKIPAHLAAIVVKSISIPVMESVLVETLMVKYL